MRSDICGFVFVFKFVNKEHNMGKKKQIHTHTTVKTTQIKTRKLPNRK